MKFSTVALLSATAGSALAAFSNTTSTETDIHTTVVTITSCDDNKCTEKPVTTGLTTVTEDNTIYTTYCPLPETSAPPKSEAPPAPPAPTTEAPETTAAPPQSKPASTHPTTLEAESSKPPAPPAVSTAENAAGKVVPGAAALVAVAALFY